MTRDTEQPRARLDYEDCGDPDKASCGFTVSDDDGEHEVKFEFGGEIIYETREAALGAQREYEDALIARALRVATDEELAEAGFVRNKALVDEYAKARQRVRVKSNAAALGSPTLAARWAVLHERAMQAVEMYIGARAKALRWRNENPTGRNPEMIKAESKGSALMRVLEEMAERRAGQESANSPSGGW